MPILTDAQQLYIWREVDDGRGSHGHFLRAFASAMCYADDHNIVILAKASRDLIKKYDLTKYLLDEDVVAEDNA